MVAMVSWPTVNDDDGTLTVGTPWAKAVSDAIKASVEDQVHSATTPTRKPFQTTDEVIAARGSLADLSTYLLVEHDADGLHDVSSTYVTAAQAGNAGIFRNLDTDSLLNNWPDGDAAAPAGRTLAGGGATIARCGAGLGDATSLAWGDWCAKVSHGGANASLTKTLLAAANYQQGYDGKKITIACRCKASVVNQASLVFDDGAVQTRGGSTGNTAPLYHVGDGTEGWIWTTATIDSGATKLEYYVESAQAGSQPYFGCFMVVFGEIVPSVYQSERMGEFYMGIQIRGELVAGDFQNKWIPQLPRDCVYMGVQGRSFVVPSGAAVILDVGKGSWNSPYTTKPDIDIGDRLVDDGVRTIPDGTYQYRCFKAGDLFAFHIDQIGSGDPGEEFTGDFMFSMPIPELDVHKV